MAETLLYQEKQRTYTAIIMPFLIIALFLILVAIRPEIIGLERGSFWRLWVLPFVLIVNLILFTSFSKLSIKITDRYLQLAFGIFRRKFYFDQIKKSLLEDYNIDNYRGYGIRLGKDKSTAFVARSGTGIRMSFKVGRDCFFTTDNQQQVLALIKAKI